MFSALPCPPESARLSPTQFKVPIDGTGDGNVVLIVGGVYYTIETHLLEEHPGFAFAIPTKKRSTDGSKTVIINRDGRIFQFIYDFLRYGRLARDREGRLMITEADINLLITEAAHFQLDDLAMECRETHYSPKNQLSDEVKIYQALKESVECASYGGDKWVVGERTATEDESLQEMSRYYGEKNTIEESTERKQYCAFVELLHSLQAPFCISGVLKYISTTPFYKTSSLGELQLDELLAEATLSPFGRGAETMIDTNVRHSYEIDVSDSAQFPSVLDVTNEIDLSPLVGGECMNRWSKQEDYTLRPYKLVIYQEGGHFDAHRDTVRGEGHIGTLVVILNSEYTGGELEVSHGGRTESVTGAYNWVAMYGDCLHKIHPVTSGTRVSLIFDVYAKPKWISCTHRWDAPSAPQDVAVERTRGAAADSSLRRAVVAGMHQQLHGYESAVITLQHLYPACQARPDFLKGGDQVLYDTLQRDFHLAVLPCSMYTLHYYDEGNTNKCYIKPLLHTALSAEDSALAKSASALRTKVIMAGGSGEHVMENQEYEYTGNESQGEEDVYIIATLQVREKQPLV